MLKTHVQVSGTSLWYNVLEHELPL